MILGRPTNLVLGAFTALLNLGVLAAKQVDPAGVGAFFTAEIILAMNGGAAAVVALVAGQTPTVNEGESVKVITPKGEPNRTVTV